MGCKKIPSVRFFFHSQQSDCFSLFQTFFTDAGKTKCHSTAATWFADVNLLSYVHLNLITFCGRARMKPCSSVSRIFFFTSCVVNLSARQWREVNGRSEETLENLISDRCSANRLLPGKQQAVNDHVCVGAVFLETVSRGM